MNVKLEPILFPKGVSEQNGFLELNTDEKSLSYTKYKGQVSGRVSIVTWLIIKISRALRSDKVVLELAASEINDIETKSSTTFKYGELNIQTASKTHKFKYKEVSDAEVESFVSQLNELRG